jgi:heme exporter protein D
MNSWQEFFNMGGYGFYVWSSYGIAFIVLLANAISPILCERNLLKTLARKARREQRHDSQT